jgi:hypothetical protein
VEISKPSPSKTIIRARYGDEGPAQERTLYQKDVILYLFRNKLILNLEKNRIIEKKK